MSHDRAGELAIPYRVWWECRAPGGAGLIIGITLLEHRKDGDGFVGSLVPSSPAVGPQPARRAVSKMPNGSISTANKISQLPQPNLPGGWTVWQGSCRDRLVSQEGNQPLGVAQTPFPTPLRLVTPDGEGISADPPPAAEPTGAYMAVHALSPRLTASHRRLGSEHHSVPRTVASASRTVVHRWRLPQGITVESCAHTRLDLGVNASMARVNLSLKRSVKEKGARPAAET